LCTGPRTGDEFVVALTGDHRDGDQLVGAKAARLGSLIVAGIPVPDAFVVTTRAFTRARGSWDREPEPDHPGTADLESLAAFALRHQDRIRSRPVPGEIADEVIRSYRELCAETGRAEVAVRTSAVTEDTEDASYAGLLSTALAVSGDNAVLEAVRECWAGGYSPHAVAYRIRHGEPWHDYSAAVIVQRMIDAVSAGVLFTGDPLTGTDTIVIEGAWGLGTGVVDGQVVPDSWTVDRDTGVVLDHRTGTKRSRCVIVPRGGGHRYDRTPSSLRARDCLAPARIRELVSLGLRAEEVLGVRADVEWALATPSAPSDPGRGPESGHRPGDGDGFWILQARPITATPKTA
jgi:pyruvate,water dikinase